MALLVLMVRQRWYAALFHANPRRLRTAGSIGGRQRGSLGLQRHVSAHATVQERDHTMVQWLRTSAIMTVEAFAGPIG
jgi:hypothetical protein